MKKKYPRKCLNCGQEFIPKNSRQVVCCVHCCIALSNKQRNQFKADMQERNRILTYGTKKEKSRLKREEKAKFKELKAKVMSAPMSYAKKVGLTKKVFQAWIRKRDEKEKCICCGKDYKSWDAGHFKKAEIYSGVIFDEINVNKQSVYCNQYLSGNEGSYREGLVKKYGEQAVKDLEERANATRQKRWTDEELELIKKKYKIFVAI